MALTDFELDRLTAARLNSFPHRQESPNKRVLQLAFEEIEFLRSELAAVGAGLKDQAEKLRVTTRRPRVRKTDVWANVEDLLGRASYAITVSKRLCRTDQSHGELRD